MRSHGACRTIGVLRPDAFHYGPMEIYDALHFSLHGKFKSLAAGQGALTALQKAVDIRHSDAFEKSTMKRAIQFREHIHLFEIAQKRGLHLEDFRRAINCGGRAHPRKPPHDLGFCSDPQELGFKQFLLVYPCDHGAGLRINPNQAILLKCLQSFTHRGLADGKTLPQIYARQGGIGWQLKIKDFLTEFFIDAATGTASAPFVLPECLAHECPSIRYRRDAIYQLYHHIV